VNMAIDREALLAITEGFGEIRSNPVPEWHWAFNPSAPSYNTRDIDQARALVEEAGATGTAPVFKYYTEFAELGLAAQIIQANLAEIGIQLQLERIDLGGYAEQVITNFDYDMSMTIYVPLFDPEDMLATVAYRYDSVALQWENAEFLNALNNANATLDPDVRLAEFGRAQEIWMNEVPGAVLGMTPARVASRDNVQDVVVATGNYALYENVILS
jgi:peptide/nickel transport system substrate-binding protein